MFRDCVVFNRFSKWWYHTWYDLLENIWAKLPKFVRQTIATLAIVLVGISINGDWISLYVHSGKQFGYFPRIENETYVSSSALSLDSFRLQNLSTYLIPSFLVSFAIYFFIGGFLHWYFYVRQRDRPEEWKCQPNKFLTPELEMNEILFGSFTLFLNSALSGIVSCYIANGGSNMVYYDVSEYGWLYFTLQFPLVFIAQDYTIYWMHRIYHIPFLYKNFHKLHHKYTCPTAFSVTAIHPVEALHIQITNIIPLFLVPLHWAPFYCSALYGYYHGIIDHSGIDLKAYWWQPWQPDTIFHDNHHQYFHVNFGFNIGLWDKIHGTYRKPDRVYREDIFYGQGKALNEVSEKELETEVEQRCSENPKAHRNNNILQKIKLVKNNKYK